MKFQVEGFSDSNHPSSRIHSKKEEEARGTNVMNLCLAYPGLYFVSQAVLFGMFTMCMMCDQWETVTTNQTQIDRLKGETHATSLEIK